LPSESNFVKLRYRLVPDHLIGEVLSKKWVDNAIPLAMLVCVVAVFGNLIPEFFTQSNLQSTSR